MWIRETSWSKQKIAQVQAYLRQCSECLLSIYKYHDSKLTCKTQRGTSPTSCTLVDTLAGPSEILMIIRCSPGCVFHWSKTLSIPREAMEYWEQDLWKLWGQGEGRTMQLSHGSSRFVHSIGTLFPSAPCAYQAGIVCCGCALRCFLLPTVPRSFCYSHHQPLLGLHIPASGQDQVVLPPRSRAKMTISICFSCPTLFTK